MAWGKPLVGLLVCCGAWIEPGGGVSRSAVIEAPLVSGLSELAAGSEAGLANGAVAANPSTATLPVIAQPCIDADEFVLPSRGCRNATEAEGSAPPPSSELPLGPAADPIVAPFEISAAASAFDFVAGQPSLPPLRAGIAPALLDELVARPEDTEDTGPFWAGRGDIVVNYAVPALAVLALVVAGLLLRELVRRRQRAALARRIKRNFRRSARRQLAPKSSRPKD
jgi:hypothetical protein